VASDGVSRTVQPQPNLGRCSHLLLFRSHEEVTKRTEKTKDKQSTNAKRTCHGVARRAKPEASAQQPTNASASKRPTADETRDEIETPACGEALDAPRLTPMHIWIGPRQRTRCVKGEAALDCGARDPDARRAFGSRRSRLAWQEQSGSASRTHLADEATPCARAPVRALVLRSEPQFRRAGPALRVVDIARAGIITD
jgi:hypothetical protein